MAYFDAPRPPYRWQLGLLLLLLPRRFIAGGPRPGRPGRLPLPAAVPLQLATGASYQRLPEPIAQVPGAGSPYGMLRRFANQSVVLREEPHPKRCGVSTRFLYLWSSHVQESTPNGPTNQEGRISRNLRQTA